jgi:hypothetical protein
MIAMKFLFIFSFFNFYSCDSFIFVKKANDCKIIVGNMDNVIDICKLPYVFVLYMAIACTNIEHNILELVLGQSSGYSVANHY